MTEHINLAQICQEFWRDKIDLDEVNVDGMENDHWQEYWQEADDWLAQYARERWGREQLVREGARYQSLTRPLWLQADQDRGSSWPFIRMIGTLVTDVANPADLAGIVNALNATGHVTCYWNPAFDTVLLETRVYPRQHEFGEPLRFDSLKLGLAEMTVRQVASWIAPVLAWRAAATTCWSAGPGTSMPGLLSPTCTPSYLRGQSDSGDVQRTPGTACPGGAPFRRTRCNTLRQVGRATRGLAPPKRDV